MAPDVPPVAVVCELPWLSAADDPLEQVSASLLMLETVITSVELELELVPVAPLCEVADAELPCMGVPLIWTCCPTWLCSWLVSPCS